VVLDLMDEYHDFDVLTAKALDFVCATSDERLGSRRSACVADAWLHVAPYDDVVPDCNRFTSMGSPRVLTNGVKSSAETALAAAVHFRSWTPSFPSMTSAHTSPIRASTPSDQHFGLHARAAFRVVERLGRDGAASQVPRSMVQSDGRAAETLGHPPAQTSPDWPNLRWFSHESPRATGAGDEPAARLHPRDIEEVTYSCSAELADVQLSPFVWPAQDHFELLLRSSTTRHTVREDRSSAPCLSIDGLRFALELPRDRTGQDVENAYEVAGAEDPTVASVDGTYYVYYTGWNEHLKRGDCCRVGASRLNGWRNAHRAPFNAGGTEPQRGGNRAGRRRTWRLFFEYAQRWPLEDRIASSSSVAGPWTVGALLFEARPDGRMAFEPGPVMRRGRAAVMFYNGATRAASGASAGSSSTLPSHASSHAACTRSCYLANVVSRRIRTLRRRSGS